MTEGKDINIQPFVGSGEPSYSMLYSVLPSHFSKLVNGVNTPLVIESRKRLGVTIARKRMVWNVVKEHVRELFKKNKLRHVATVEEAEAEIEQVYPLWKSEMLLMEMKERV